MPAINVQPLKRIAKPKTIAFQREARIKSINNLSFTSRDNLGSIVWWDVTPPKTEYWAVHHMLGRAYGYELIDLLYAPESDIS